MLAFFGSGVSGLDAKSVSVKRVRLEVKQSPELDHKLCWAIVLNLFIATTNVGFAMHLAYLKYSIAGSSSRVGSQANSEQKPTGDPEAEFGRNEPRLERAAGGPGEQKVEREKGPRCAVGGERGLGGSGQDGESDEKEWPTVGEEALEGLAQETRKDEGDQAVEEGEAEKEGVTCRLGER